jgi:hypothetical protein
LFPTKATPVPERKCFFTSETRPILLDADAFPAATAADAAPGATAALLHETACCKDSISPTRSAHGARLLPPLLQIGPRMRTGGALPHSPRSESLTALKEREEPDSPKETRGPRGSLSTLVVRWQVGRL